MIRNFKFSKGYTLIELMTAISIFIIVMTISMGSILGIFDASRKSRSLKAVMNNLNLAIETMSKEMRYGKNYHCGGGTLADPQDCPEGQSLFGFLSSDGEQIAYRHNGAAIEKSVAGGAYIAVTAPEVIIDKLYFYTIGTSASDAYQPHTVMILVGHAGSGRGRSDFNIETAVSQRAIN